MSTQMRKRARRHGLEPDTRLRVFNTTFMAHSTYLRTHSEVLGASLDWANADASSGSEGPVKYYFSTVKDGNEDDEGLCWFLKRVGPDFVEEEGQFDGLSKSFIQRRVNAFDKVLAAMYLRPWTIANANELESMYLVADYLDATHCIRMTLSDAMARSHKFVESIEKDTYAFKLLLLAFKIQHEPLYKECMVHCVSQWFPESKTGDRVLDAEVQMYRLRLDKRISIALLVLLCLASRKPSHESCQESYRALRALITDTIYDILPDLEEDNDYENPLFFLRISRAEGKLNTMFTREFFKAIIDKTLDYKDYTTKREIRNAVAPLMEVNLKLSSHSADVYKYSQRFLCTKVTELPWEKERPTTMAEVVVQDDSGDGEQTS